MANIPPAVRQGAIAGTISFLMSKAVLPWILTGAAPAVTVYLGWWQSQLVPWIWVWLAALISPVFVLVALREFETRRQLNQVDGKILFSNGMAHETSVQDGRRVVTVVQPFVRLMNTAPFRISLVVDEISTRVDGHAHQYRVGVERLCGPIPIEPSTGMDCRDIPVEIPGGIAAERFTGAFTARLRYGHPGRETYPIAVRSTFEVVNPANSTAVQAFFSPAVANQQR